MIGLLVDAAIAVVIVLDRLCAAVEKAARPQASPRFGVGVPPAGTGSPVQATSAGGHLNLQRHEPLVWGDHYIPHN